MKILDFLNKDNWIKDGLAKDKYNNDVDFDSPDACKWCIWGAMMRCYGIGPANNIRLKMIVSDRTFTSIGEWNDDPNRTFKDVKALVKKYDI